MCLSREQERAGYRNRLDCWKTSYVQLAVCVEGAMSSVWCPEQSYTPQILRGPGGMGKFYQLFLFCGQELFLET